MRLTWIDRAQRGRVLLVEGEVADVWSDLLNDECIESLGSAVPGDIDLSGVTHVDRGGFETLRQLVSRGFRLVGENAWIAEVRRTGGW